MKIGDEVYVHGYVDEIRKHNDKFITVIISNKGGYFGTDISELVIDHDGCAGCKHIFNTSKEEPCSRCRFAYELQWEAAEYETYGD